MQLNYDDWQEQPTGGKHQEKHGDMCASNHHCRWHQGCRGKTPRWRSPRRRHQPTVTIQSIGSRKEASRNAEASLQTWEQKWQPSESKSGTTKTRTWLSK